MDYSLITGLATVVPVGREQHWRWWFDLFVISSFFHSFCQLIALTFAFTLQIFKFVTFHFLGKRFWGKGASEWRVDMDK